MANEKANTTGLGASQEAQAVNSTIAGLGICGANVRQLVVTIRELCASGATEELIPSDLLQASIDPLKG